MGIFRYSTERISRPSVRPLPHLSTIDVGRRRERQGRAGEPDDGANHPRRRARGRRCDRRQPLREARLAPATRLSAAERIGRTPPRGKRFSPLVGLPQDDDRVAAGIVLIIAEGTVGGGPEFEAIAGAQPVRDVPLDKDEPSVQHPDELTDKRVSGGGEGDRGTRRQLDLDKVKRKVRPGCRGDLAANISRGGVRPARLVFYPDEPPGAGRLGTGEQCRQGEPERT